MQTDDNFPEQLFSETTERCCFFILIFFAAFPNISEHSSLKTFTTDNTSEFSVVTHFLPMVPIAGTHFRKNVLFRTLTLRLI